MPFPLLSDRQMSSEGENGTSAVMPEASLWRNQPWYPMLLKLMTEFSLLLPDQKDILMNLEGQMHPLVGLNRLRICTWKISSDSIKQQEFQRKLQNYCWLGGAKGQIQFTNLDGNEGVAGVREGRQISFFVEYNLLRLHYLTVSGYAQQSPPLTFW